MRHEDSRPFFASLPRATAFRSLLGIACGLLVAGGIRAETVTFYDGTQQAVTPGAYSPQRLAFAGFGGSQTYEAASQATRLTTDVADQAGFSNFLGPLPVGADTIVLDRQQGYRVSFSLEMLSESHPGNPQRAGFSVLAVGNDVGSGTPSSIEIGFQTNRIFAQNDGPLFGSPSAAESTFNPVGVGFVDYDLLISGTGYQLSAGGAIILTGELQDYTAFTGLLNPYSTPNLLFFGDNTTSAGADVRLQSVSVTAIPEPSMATALFVVTAVGSVPIVAVRRRRRINS